MGVIIYLCLRGKFPFSFENEKINLDELEDLESLYSHSMWARLGNGKQKVKYYILVYLGIRILFLFFF